jgi:hypothetical protein
VRVKLGSFLTSALDGGKWVRLTYLYVQPEDEPFGSKLLEDIKIKNQNISLGNVHFVCLFV